MPGNHSVGSPSIRCQRVSASSIVSVIAWPRCSAPVTFGGGMMIVNGSRPFASAAGDGANQPPSSQNR